MNRVVCQILMACAVCLVVSSCVKGPMWRSGYLSPWARQRWAEEDRIAPTMFAKHTQLNQLLVQANRGSQAERDAAVEHLAKIASSDPVLMARVAAVNALGQIDLPSARAAIRVAAQDSDVEVRKAAIFACGQSNHPDSIQVLQGIIGGDSDVDIRLAATRTLSHFRGPEAIKAASLALDDPNPALQLRAADSLQAMTGKNYGHDVAAWQAFVRESTPTKDSIQPVTFAEQPSDSATTAR